MRRARLTGARGPGTGSSMGAVRAESRAGATGFRRPGCRGRRRGRVGAGAYVAANATGTKDVPPDYGVLNANEFVPIGARPGALERKQWGGAPLSSNGG